jgi:hypothetical protein
MSELYGILEEKDRDLNEQLDHLRERLLDIINTNTEELKAIKIRFEYVGKKSSEYVGEKGRIDRMIDDCDDKHKYYVDKYKSWFMEED